MSQRNPHDRSELDICQGCLNCDGTRAEVEIILKPIVGQADLKYAVNDILNLIAQRDRQHKERLLAYADNHEWDFVADEIRQAINVLYGDSDA